MNSVYKIQPIDYQQIEENANIFFLKCLTLMQIVHAFILFLNILNIFIVDYELMNKSFLLSTLVVLVTYLLCSLLGTKRPIVKYIIITGLVVSITIINIYLTYHAILTFVLPLLYSIQYYNKKLSYFSCAISIIGMYISVMIGYFYGICDANMAALTNHPLDRYYNEITGVLNFGTVNDNPWVTLPLFFVFPRALVLMLLMPITSRIADGIAKRAVQERDLVQLSETDEMTETYNRNKYMDMKKHYYTKVNKVGVIFWDVNGLKTVNDTLGHEYGDYLIISISDSIKEFSAENKKVYRIGGDEFVMVIEDATEEILNEILTKWRKEIQRKNSVSKIALSASVGYALGDGNKIDDIINEADVNMYKEKRRYHLKVNKVDI